jgi:hypothetical protein
MASEESPAAIRSIAVSADDVVDAFVYDRENPGAAVLRVTPPFHGRMRARLHVYHDDDAHLTGAIHFSPSVLLSDDIVDAYPRLEDDRTRESNEQARQHHAQAIEAWCKRASAEIVETVAIETDEGTRRIDLKTLGA